MTTSNLSGTGLEQLNLNLLPSLSALLQERNVSGAARRMGVSQSAMSHALARLRSLLDDPLLVVSAGGMVATPRAVQLAIDLPPLLAALREALAGPKQFDPATAEHTFVIASADYFEISTLPDVLGYLRQHAPGVRLRVQGFGPRTGQQLVSGELDFAFGGESLTMPSTLMRQLLYRDPFSVIARADHPKLGPRLSLRRYLELDHLLISLEGRSQGLVDRLLEEQKQSRRIALCLPHFGSAALAVLHSDMICTIASTIAERAKTLYGVRIFKPPLAIPAAGITAWWPRQHQEQPAHRWFRKVFFGGDALSPSIRKLMRRVSG